MVPPDGIGGIRGKARMAAGKSTAGAGNRKNGRPPGRPPIHRKRFQENPLSFSLRRQYRKPTQVVGYYNTEAYGRFTVKELGKFAP